MKVYALFIVMIVLTLAVLPFILIARARVMNSDVPRLHLVLDMDNQIKFKPQHANASFRDKRAMRPAVDGSVAYGDAELDDRYYRGRVGDRFATTFPKQIEITKGFIEHGRQRFEIYCAPCHGLSGHGDGMVAQRAEQLQEGTWTPPLSFHEKTVIDRPHGHIFNTITNGIRNMPAYGDQIPVQDRWAIVAYVRALQKSEDATIDDVPADKRQTLLDQIQ